MVGPVGLAFRMNIRMWELRESRTGIIDKAFATHAAPPIKSPFIVLVPT
jgi:hypothetical protein